MAFEYTNYVMEVKVKKFDKKFIFWINESTYDQLKELAVTDKSSMSRIIRVLIDDASQSLKISTSLDKNVSQ
jgi:hypothetical protein